MKRPSRLLFFASLALILGMFGPRPIAFADSSVSVHGPRSADRQSSAAFMQTPFFQSSSSDVSSIQSRSKEPDFSSSHVNYLFLLLDFICILILSFFLSSLFYTPTQIHRILLGWLFFTAIVVSTGYFLSLCHFLNSRAAWLLSHLALLPITGAIYLRFRVSSNARSFHRPNSFPPWLIVLGIGFLIAFVAMLALNIFLPLHFIGYDGISYHLPRVYFYLQHGSLDAYPTFDIRQTDFPMVAELQYLWLVLFTKSVPPLFGLQWIWLFMSGLAVYAACRSVELRSITSIAVALFWISTPDIILHSAWIKNDLPAAAYGITALAFILRIRDSFPIAVTGAAIAIGLAVGTKYTALFPCAGILLAAVFLLIYKPFSISKLWVFLISVAGAILLLGSYSFIDIFLRGAGPSMKYPASYTMFRIDYVMVNILRLLGELTDSLALIPIFLTKIAGHSFPDIRTPVFRLLAYIPGCNVFGSRGFWAWDGAGKPYRLGISPMGFSLGTLALIGVGLILSFKQLSSRRIKAIVIAGIIAVISQTGVLLWQPLTFLRLYLPALVLFYPLAGLGLEWGFPRFPVLKWVVVLTALLGMLSPLVYYGNTLRLYYDPDPATFHARSIQIFPRDHEIMQFVKTLPKNAGIAIEGGRMAEFLLIGKNWSRYVLPIPIITKMEQLPKIFRKHPQVKAIIFSTEGKSGLAEIGAIPVGKSFAAVARPG